jgi:hypothetical protein
LSGLVEIRLELFQTGFQGAPGLFPFREALLQLPEFLGLLSRLLGLLVDRLLLLEPGERAPADHEQEDRGRERPLHPPQFPLLGCQR